MERDEVLKLKDVVGLLKVIEKMEDNNLPIIAEKYREFLKKHDG